MNSWRRKRAKATGFTVKVFEHSPILYYIEGADGVLELHVDDGRGTGKPEVDSRLLQYLEKHTELKWIRP